MIKVPNSNLWFDFTRISFASTLRLRPSTAVDKTFFQCTKFWIKQEAPMWVVELVSPEVTGIIWGVLVSILNFGAFWPLRSQFHEKFAHLFDFYLRMFLVCGRDVTSF